MQRLTLFLSLALAANAAGLDYVPLFDRACSTGAARQNGRALAVEAVRLVQRNGLTKLTALRINGREAAIAHAEVSEADAPLPLNRVDLDQDGNDDLALNHRSGIRNRYFHYFLYNPTMKDYEALGEFPELRLDAQGLYSSEFDGPKEVIKRLVMPQKIPAMLKARAFLVRRTASYQLFPIKNHFGSGINAGSGVLLGI